ncbi:MAG: SGNH hydrolase-type esterase domain-containing protein [Monoraphidium minutum]|nr:MAG: SGNH hydrolase-type esterase domain-containing protein [Monoraphidium minutum]
MPLRAKRPACHAALTAAALLAALALLQPIYAQVKAPGQDGAKAFLPQHAWSRKNILLFGDSITELAGKPEGWGVMLADRYQRRADVLNRGFGGYTSKQALQILPEILESVDLRRAALAVVWFGTNDAVNTKGPQSFMHVPIDKYISNLKQIMQSLKGAGVSNVMLVTPPPVDDAKRAASVPGYPPDRKLDLAKQYAAATVQAGKEAGAPVLNSQAPGGAWSGRFLLADGLHLNPEGQKAFYKMLNDFIWSNFESARPDNLPYHHPAWEGIKYDASAAQFEKERGAAKSG